ncbi:DUF305 domain-containing protein [Rhodococcus artemisiae]|uniref:DUF305 domain-containing protein n=1 Tax=Rhodococcus artemisiae TaxID=714159 RepID=A0ABU7L6U9_9NOCA|nr:DUF305 domain-containing protein [Rhodococcus artemisiae]MEE2057265.1 DUF305 domain-containing protein [Rhodococcus artemisiae]
MFERRMPVYKKTLAVGVTALGVVFAAAGCGDADTEASSSIATSSVTSPVASSADDAAAHDEADVMFAQMMLPHHAQAIEMSNMLLGKEDIPASVAALAEQIKAAQGPEIEQLESWLEQWGQPTYMSDDMPAMNHDMHDADGGTESMEGMLSEADMQALSEAQGTEAARLYLTGMIEHHDGAVDMAQTEIEHGQFPDAVAMARTIVDTQQQEIETMRELLTTL